MKISGKRVDNYRKVSADNLTIDSLKLNGYTNFVSNLYDFPTPTNGVIDLPVDSNWFILNDINLNGYRLNCLGNVCIRGFSSETTLLHSDLKTGESLITSAYTLPIQNISLSTSSDAKIFNLNSDGSNGIDFYAVNIIGGICGTIANYSNVVFNDSAFVNHDNGFTFTGTFDTIAFNNCLFTSSAPYHIYLPNTLTVNRRLRITYSSLVVDGTRGIYYDSPTIPDESFILDTINFSGDGIKVDGISYLDNKTNFLNCIGITNSFSSSVMYLQGNTTPTTFSGTGVNTKILGTTTTNNNLNSKFTHSTGRLTYTGAKAVVFSITISANISGSNNRDGHLMIAKDNAAISTSEIKFRTTGAGNFSPVSTSQVVELTTNNYIEIFIRNDTDATNITVEDMVVSIIRIY